MYINGYYVLPQRSGNNCSTINILQTNNYNIYTKGLLTTIKFIAPIFAVIVFITYPIVIYAQTIVTPELTGLTWWT